MMNARAVLRPLRTFRPVLPSSSLAAGRRWNSRATSPTTEFYKTFTRPVLKCLLVAMLTYQLAYFGWVKLEQDETKDDRDVEITKLEAQVKSLQNKGTGKSA